MLTNARKISSKIVAALCAATLLLGIFVFSTSAQEPTEMVSADIPYGTTVYFNPDNFIYRCNISEYSIYEDHRSYIVEFALPVYDILIGEGGTYDEPLYNLIWLSCSYYAQNESGDLELLEYNSPPIPFASLYNYSGWFDFHGLEGGNASLYYVSSDDNIEGYFTISSYPDYIESFYINVGNNPEINAYNQGFISGSNSSDSEDIYYQGYNNGYNNGYSDGYDTASSEIENQNALGLFGRGILDGLLDVYFDTFRVPIFGTTLGEILGYFIFFIWVLVVVKIVSFVI